MNKRYPDILLLVLLLAMFATGLVALYSAGGEERFWIQLWRGLACIAVMLVIACMPLRWLEGLTPAVFVAVLLLLVGVLLFGVKINNARRWLNTGVLLQPSEFMKIALPMSIAYFYARQKNIHWWSHFVAMSLIFPAAFLVVKQPDLGTSVIIAAAGMSAVFFGGITWRWLAGLGVAGVAMLPLLWNFALKPYQKNRILTLFDPSQDPLGAGYHTIQSEIAIGSGGFWGKGFLSGTQAQFGFLPERHTDFIFSVFAEEFGFIGGCFLLTLACLIAWRSLVIAGRTGSRFGLLASAGIVSVFFITFAVNLSMVSGLLPVVGMPLPLVSYGGTALLATFAGFGVILSASRVQRGEA